MVDKKNNNVQHKRITSREDNYIRQRDLFAVANSVVVAEILAKFSALTVTNIQYEKFSSVMQTLFSEGFWHLERELEAAETF